MESPTISQVSPQVVTAGTPSVTVTVQGANFQSQAALTVNGTAVPTTVVNSTTLAANISGTTGTAGSRAVAGAEQQRILFESDSVYGDNCARADFAVDYNDESCQRPGRHSLQGDARASGGLSLTVEHLVGKYSVRADAYERGSDFGNTDCERNVHVCVTARTPHRRPDKTITFSIVVTPVRPRPRL